MELEHKVKKPAQVIFDYLTDMQQFVTVHPVIYRIDNLGQKKYLVFEKLYIGFIPYAFTYTVFVNSDLASQTVNMTANVMKIVRIDMTYQIKETSDYSLVYERITFRSFLPVKAIMTRIFTAQHKQLFVNIEASL